MWPILRRLRRNPFATAVLGAAALALLTAGCYGLHLDFATATPLYLLLVVLQALSGSFLWSAVVSVLAVGCMDYFFVDPLFSFAVAGRLSLVALISFLMTSLVITRLVTKVRKEATVSTLHKDRIDRLYHLAQQILALDPETA